VIDINVVEADGFELDQRFTGFGCGCGGFFVNQAFRPAAFVNDDCFHNSPCSVLSEDCLQRNSTRRMRN
jgi:hypothetical protein